jgi:hypothetical protein
MEPLQVQSIAVSREEEEEEEEEEEATEEEEGACKERERKSRKLVLSSHVTCDM